MSSGKIWKIVCIVFMALFTFCGVDFVYAEGGAWIGTGSGSSGSSSGGGGGGGSACSGDVNLHTGTYGWREDCAGASWVFYKSNEGVEPRDITFPDGVKNDHAIKNAEIPKVCSEHSDSGGGFWHFGSNYYGGDKSSASVGGVPGHNRTLNWGYYINTMSKWPGNLLVPIVGVNQTIADGLYTADSEKSSAATESAVLKDFRAAYAADKGWDEKDSRLSTVFLPNDLYAFCWWNDMSKDYYAVSNVDNGAAPGFGSTGIVSTSPESPAWESETTVTKGSKTDLTFSHNLFSKNKSEDKVKWYLTRDGLDASGIEIAMDVEVSTNVTSGEITFTEVDGSYYAPEGRGGKMGSSLYLVRERYTVTFKEVGKYTFCESITNEAAELTTKVCSTVNVEEGIKEVSGECGNWTPLSYTSSGTFDGSTIEATTSIEAKIKNNDLTARRGNATNVAWYSGWFDADNQPLYARPTDKITWLNCYYPGVQALAKEKVSTSDEEPGGSNTSTDPKDFKDYITWTNNFDVITETDSTINKIKTNFQKPDSVTTSDGVKVTHTSNSELEARPLYWKMDADVDVGVTDVKYTMDTYKVKNANDTGKWYKQSMSADGIPYYAKVTFETHTWHPHCCCCSSDCGEDGDECCCSSNCDCNYHTDTVFRRGNYADTEYKNKKEGEIPDSKLDDSNEVRIPYNYDNSADLSVKFDGGYAYAGESVSVTSSSVTVGKRWNETTYDMYATQVDEAEVRLVAYVTTNPEMNERWINGNGKTDELCDLINDDKRTLCRTDRESGTMVLNPDGKLEGYTHATTFNSVNFNETYNVFDASAGDQFCMAMAVWPARSGILNNTSEDGDKNMSPAGNKQWYISVPQCATIAKRPSMQVLGGSVFSNGNMVANVNEKNNFWENYSYITDYIPLHNNSGSQRVRFGTWVEEAIVANGEVQQIASGAALGHNEDSAVGIGEREQDLNFCARWVPLTFANYSSAIGYPCSTGNKSAGGAGIWPPTSNRSALVDYWGVVGVTESDDVVQVYDIANPSGWTEVRSLNEKNILELNTDNTVTVHGGTIVRNQTRIVKTTGDVNIWNNIEYANEGLGSAGEVPQVVIYAGRDINISCNVSRIDAILIAGGTVRTCANNPNGVGSQAVGSKTAGEYSLTIRGMVIANEMEATREYGNGVGDHSGDPAETINYDTSALVWGRYMAGSGESNTLTLTYQHELAPRL